MKVAIDTYPLHSGHQFRGIGKNTENLINALGIFHPEITVITNGFDDADIIHYTHFDLFFHTLPLHKPKPSIVTIHDVIPLLYPTEFPVGIRGKVNLYLQKLSLIDVKAIITISETSKFDIVKYLGISEERIYVRYLAPHERFRPLDALAIEKVKQKYHLPELFVLYVGDINYNKNVPGLIRAFNAIKRSDVSLLLVGKSFGSKGIKEIESIDQAIAEGGKRDKIVMPGYIPDDDLPALYNLSQAVVVPSFYEGFGYQLVEGFACGVPVISSDRSSLKEVGGDATYVINPDDTNSIREGIETVLEDQALRKRLIALGFERQKMFGLKQYADKTVAVYKRVYDRYCNKTV